MTRNMTLILPHETFIDYWKKVWRYRSLLLFLSWRDILIRYKQTHLGIAWAIVRPLLSAVVLFFVFNRIAGIKSDLGPYFMIVFSGSMVWQFIASTLNESSTSLISNPSLVNKIYFPRVLLPASVILVNLLDQLISFGVLLILIFTYQLPFPKHIYLIPFALMWSVIFAFGLGILLASVNVKYRDMKFVLPYAIQLWLFLSPIGFPSTEIPTQWRWVYFLNPVAGIVDTYRLALLSAPLTFPTGIGISLLVSLLIIIFGTRIFFKAEETLADTI